ncbi:MAG: short-chain dehydrogenase/reductase [Deltaproteobacteria bacterium]|nr:short-chain dehydrogenase/reductase [Deltaproteobacteria bacterium]
MVDLAGKRALVTGASSGIGAAIARNLADHGVNLVVTARRQDELDQLATELRAKGITVDVVTADLGRSAAATTLWTEVIATGPIDILINNAGFGYFRPFADADWHRDAELLQLNVTSLVELSRRFIESRQGESRQGESRQGESRQGDAYLVNIASIAAYQSVPNFAVYAASKVFVRNFTEALHDELVRGHSEISATCICPGGTTTAFHAAAGAGDYGWLANASMLSAEAVAEITVRAMRKRKRTVVTGWLNKLSCWAVRLVPRSIASWMAGRVLGKPRPSALPPRGK